MTFRRHALAVAAALALTTALALPAAHAFEIPTPDPELKVLLDLTPKVSAAYRLKNASPNLTKLDVAADPGISNEDDGDHNFNKGLISRRYDLLGELDVSARNWGARLSGTAWHDGVYLGRSDYQGTPLLAGPGAIVATMVFSKQVDDFGQFAAVGLGVIAVHVTIWLAMRFSLPILRVIRESGVLLVTRIAGLLLSAIAVQMVANALRLFINGDGWAD